MVFNRRCGVPVLVLLTVFLLSPAGALAGWDQLDSGVVDDLYDIHFVSNSTGYAVGWGTSYGGVILRTTNVGADWERTIPVNGSYLFSTDFSDSETGFVVGCDAGSTFYGLILRTTDGGDSWTTKLVSSTNGFYTVDFVTDMIGYACGWQGCIVKTTNAGDTWTPTNTGTSVIFRWMHFISPDIGYAVGGSNWNNPNRVFRTTNGNDWTEVHNFGSGTVIGGIHFFENETGIVGGHNGNEAVMRTTDAGESWEVVHSGPPSSAIQSLKSYDNVDNRCWAVGEQGRVLRSEDMGQTWILDGVTNPERLLLGVCDDGGRAAYVTGMNGLICRRVYNAAGQGIVTGPGPLEANPPNVRLFNIGDDWMPLVDFPAYGSPHWGVKVNTGDPDGDGRDEILTGAGPGAIYGPHVRGFEADSSPMPGLSFIAYGTLKYGVNVAAGDLDGDGFDEIITGAGPGAVFGPHVRAWDYDGTPGVTPVPGVSYFAYGTPKWGVNVACGDIDGDGFDEIVTGAGPGDVYGPHVRGWNVDGGTAASIPAVSFLAYGTNKYGVNVCCGDVDGDGIDEIVTAPGPSPVFGAHIRGWDFDGGTLAELPGYNFFAWQPYEALYGAQVFAGVDFDNNGYDDLLVGIGPDPSLGSLIRGFQYTGGSPSQILNFSAYPPDRMGGVYVAAGNF